MKKVSFAVWKFRRNPGFTLVELAIVLAVAALLFAGLWRLMSSGNQQMRDQAAADQMKQLVSAVQGYLTTAEAQALLTATAANGTIAISLPSAAWASVAACSPLTAANPELCNYLPQSFNVNTTNPYNQIYNIRVRKDAQPAGSPARSYSFMIMTSGGDTIPDTSGGNISGMIGNSGGFIYSQDVCNATTGAATKNSACGSYGSWASSVIDYGFAGGASGRVAALQSFVPGTDSNIWLARRLYPDGATPPTDYNTMSTDLFLGGNILYGGTNTTNISGRIENMRQVLMGDSSTAIGSPALTVNVNCKHPDAGCTETAIQANGDVMVTGKMTSYYFIYNTTSDERLKHEIKPLENSLEKLSKIRALSFVMNDSGASKMGVTAQDVEKVYPELVVDQGDGYKGVDYMGFIGPLIGAIHELKAENETLRRKIDGLEEIVKKLQEKQAP